MVTHRNSDNDYRFLSMDSVCFLHLQTQSGTNRKGLTNVHVLKLFDCSQAIRLIGASERTLHLLELPTTHVSSSRNREASRLKQVDQQRLCLTHNTTYLQLQQVMQALHECTAKEESADREGSQYVGSKMEQSTT
jgi:hypothetical protein